MKYYLGIDPGKRGAFAVIDENQNLVNYWLNKLPIYDIKKNLESRSYAKIVIERQQALGGLAYGREAGTKSAFTTGLGYGKLLAILELSGKPFTEVAPQTWQSKLLGKTRGNSKELAIDYCKKMHPDETFVPPTCRVVHDGVTDAVAIAHYACRFL